MSYVSNIINISMISLQNYFHEMKTIQTFILCFIENEENTEENYENLVKIIEDNNIRTNKYKLKIFLYIINQISNYHRHCHNFFEKIERILANIQPEMHKNFTNSEIFNIFINNKRILLFLFEKNIVTIDDQIFNKMVTKSTYLEYFSPEIKSFFDVKKQQKDASNYIKFSQQILNISKNEMANFNKKRKKGENEDEICEMIRNDNINKFIKFVNSKNLSVKDLYVTHSIFETNPFLLYREKTLIKYAAYFGSIKIFNYLYKNGAYLSHSLWIYAIHSANDEIIHFLLDNKISLPQRNKESEKNESENDFGEFINDNNDIVKLSINNITYERCVIESIMCHHNDIACYIIKNCMNKDNSFFTSSGFRFYNFFYITEISEYKQLLFYGCKYDYYEIVDYLLKAKDIDINSTVILNIINFSHRHNILFNNYLTHYISL